MTAQLGLLRTLTAGEIVEQIIIALNDAYGVGTKTPRGANLVAMGAGEPLPCIRLVDAGATRYGRGGWTAYCAQSRQRFNRRRCAAH
ncbi:MAG: hypothetical protein WKF84_29910 [Pyrinomonadaceae bacterium]